jgi:deazaflavin-dependent oxidoreductase (nitroreductase family)
MVVSLRFLNRFVNPFVRALLRSPFHPLASSALVVITYTGRQTGRRRSLPVLYARDGERLVVVVGSAERKRWWRNLRGGGPVEVRLRGQDRRGRGRVVSAEPELEQGLGLYLARFPRAAKSLGIPLDADGRPAPAELRAAAANTVLVVVELDPAAPPVS